MPAENGIYVGTVFHERHTPFTHKFKYRVFTLWTNIDDLPRLSQDLSYFSFGKWNILSIQNKDHAARDGSEIRPWIERAAHDKNIDISGGKIYMLGFARLWGYVFNPLTIFYCYDRNETLKAILYQVKNTFGEQHGYILPVEEIKADKIAQKCDKIFHVSPFIDMGCTYNFRIKEPNQNLDVGIHQFINDGEKAGEKILTATWDGKYYEFTDKNILKAVLKHPLMTLKVIAGIHWEALWIWIKGAAYIPKPKPPKTDIS